MSFAYTSYENPNGVPIFQDVSMSIQQGLLTAISARVSESVDRESPNQGEMERQLTPGGSTLIPGMPVRRAGRTTLLKLLANKIFCTKGIVFIPTHLRSL